MSVKVVLGPSHAASVGESGRRGDPDYRTVAQRSDPRWQTRTHTRRPTTPRREGLWTVPRVPAPVDSSWAAPGGARARLAALTRALPTTCAQTLQGHPLGLPEKAFEVVDDLVGGAVPGGWLHERLLLESKAHLTRAELLDPKDVVPQLDLLVLRHDQN